MGEGNNEWRWGPQHFSLVLGGPLYQLFRRGHLAGTTLEFVPRRIIVLSLLAWLPLAVLAALDGKAWGGSVRVPFFLDIETYIRFLVVLPMMIGAELTVHRRTSMIARRFVEREVIPEAAFPRFAAALDGAVRLRNSVLAEVLLIVFVYAAGFFVWSHATALGVPTWYATPSDSGLALTPAGWWYCLFSLPFFQFIIVRWLWRFMIWSWLLWRVARLDLQLIPTHPDNAAGLGFLNEIVFAFGPLLAAIGAMLGGVIGGKILFEGADLMDFQVEAAVVVAVVMAVVFAPLLAFTPVLARVRYQGLIEYGALAERYVRRFDRKWVRGEAPTGETLLGSADIRSLADIGRSYEAVRNMRVTVFAPRTALRLAVTMLAPASPLLLTKIPLKQLLAMAVKALF